MLIRSGDIRDQSRKLSEMAQNFGRCFALSNFWGQAFQNLNPFYHPCVNFKPNFKFSRLKFFRGNPRPTWDVR